jgi:hypothetical protein
LPPHVAASVSAQGLKPSSVSLRPSPPPSLQVGHRRATASIYGASRLTSLLVSLCRSPLVAVPEPQPKQVAVATRVTGELVSPPSCLGKERCHAMMYLAESRPPNTLSFMCRASPPKLVAAVTRCQDTPSTLTQAPVSRHRPSIPSCHRHADVVTIRVPPTAV